MTPKWGHPHHWNPAVGKIFLSICCFSNKYPRIRHVSPGAFVFPRGTWVAWVLVGLSNTHRAVDTPLPLPCVNCTFLEYLRVLGRGVRFLLNLWPPGDQFRWRQLHSHYGQLLFPDVRRVERCVLRPVWVLVQTDHMTLQTEPIMSPNALAVILCVYNDLSFIYMCICIYEYTCLYICVIHEFLYEYACILYF